ncbi:protein DETOXIFICATION 10-like [Rutidosis leptorrhynchoides]|uniref:protein DETOXIFICATION 10-like n=1 Tax=Rutidosis leptorrhynchoides TaxID=125765 RepID=UPI003A99411B
MEVAGRPEKETWEDFSSELKKVSVIAAPMVLVALLQYVMQMMAVVMVLHIDRLSLSSVAIATSFTNITGFSLLSGLVGGLETLCGQACGAKQYNKIGVYTGTAIISLLLICIPVSISWCFLDKFLILMGKDPLITLEACKYAIYLIPSLFCFAILKPLMRSLQSQSLISPLLVSSILALCLHIPLCWTFVLKLKMGSVGAAMAFNLANVFYLMLIVLYVKFASVCENTFVSFTNDALFGIKEFLWLAVPSAIMICLKWWSLELLLLISDMLPNPTLETTVLSISLTMSTLHFNIPYGLGAAASSRVSNEIGAGNLSAARQAVRAVMFLAISEAILVSRTLFSFAHFFGNDHTNRTQVVSYVVSMTPFISISFITDSLDAATAGIARGGGWQHIGAYVNLVAFNLFGIPLAFVLGLPLHLKAKGLWIGIMIGSVIQATHMSLITGLTDWRKQAMKVEERLKNTSSLVDKDINIKE